MGLLLVWNRISIQVQYIIPIWRGRTTIRAAAVFPQKDSAPLQCVQLEFESCTASNATTQSMTYRLSQQCCCGVSLVLVGVSMRVDLWRQILGCFSGAKRLSFAARPRSVTGCGATSLLATQATNRYETKHDVQPVITRLRRPLYAWSPACLLVLKLTRDKQHSKRFRLQVCVMRQTFLGLSKFESFLGRQSRAASSIQPTGLLCSIALRAKPIPRRTSTVS